MLNLALHKIGGRGEGEKNIGCLVHGVGIKLGVQQQFGKEVASAPHRGHAAVPLNNYRKQNVLCRSECVGTAVGAVGTALMVGGGRDRSMTETCRAQMSTNGQELPFRALLTLDNLVIYPRGISRSPPFSLF